MHVIGAEHQIPRVDASIDDQGRKVPQLTIGKLTGHVVNYRRRPSRSSRNNISHETGDVSILRTTGYEGVEGTRARPGS